MEGAGIYLGTTALRHDFTSAVYLPVYPLEGKEHMYL